MGQSLLRIRTPIRMLHRHLLHEIKEGFTNVSMLLEYPQNGCVRVAGNFSILLEALEYVNP